MTLNLYKGYIPLSGKQATMAFKGKTKEDLLTLEQAKRHKSYGGILEDTTILIDIDTQVESDILFKIVQEKQVKCKVIATNKGKHFLFHVDKPISNRTRVKIGIGLTVDIKGCGSASYQCLKLDGVEREVLYDTGEYQILPKYLEPIKTNMDIIGLSEGDGRNNALFSYILPLTQNDFTKEECRECITIINQYVLKEPMVDSELASVLRDGAFEKPTFFNSRGVFLFDKFAKYFQRAENIIKINNQLYIYKDGIYTSGDDEIESVMIKHIPNLSKTKRQEVLAYLRLLVNKESAISDANFIAFKNGVYNIVDDTFSDFSPEYIITNKIPHNYNPSATSELLDNTMMKLACGDNDVYNLLYQSIGYCFYRRNELRKSFFLLGEKRNGKSTFLDMVGTLLGEDNTSNLDLCDIGHQFRTAELTGKLANIGDDINDEWISNTSVFKKVVSGDIVTVEKKGKDPYKLKSFTKFFFSANAIPRLGRGQDSSAVLDRLVIIPFNARFSKLDPDYDPFIKYKLRKEDVMEALIVKALQGLRTVLGEQEFVHCSKVDHNLEEFELTNNPILQFFGDLEDSDYLNESIKVVYQSYVSFCLANNLKAIAALEFQKQMKNYFNLEIKTIKSNGKRIKVYYGKVDG